MTFQKPRHGIYDGRLSYLFFVVLVVYLMGFLFSFLAITICFFCHYFALLPCFFSLVLNCYQRFFLARLSLVFFSNLSVLIFAATIGKGAGFQSVFIALMILSMVIFEFRKKWYRRITLLLPVFFYFLLELSNYSMFPKITTSAEFKLGLNHSLFFLTLLIVFISVRLVYVSHRDREEDLLIAVSDKDTLLREIHHRVKNSLQLSSSLISLKIRDLKNDDHHDLMTEFQSRIMAIAGLHDVLQTSDSLEMVQLRPYVDGICRLLRQSIQGSAKDVQSEIELSDSFCISVKYAHCLGLIINEMLSNSLKHAFSGISEPKFGITVETVESGNLALVFWDNGIGFDCDFSLKQSSFGLKLIQMFTAQLGGTLHFSSEKNYTQFILDCPHLQLSQENKPGIPMR